jgi:hypothetical protein
MYPTLLALQPDMAKSCLIIVLIVCKSKAKATVYGYKERCLWESDDIGEELHLPGL